MSTITLTTPALLFPAISLLLLAFTNRFLAISSLIRQLHTKYLDHPDTEIILGQIKNLRTRLFLIRNMQAFGVVSFFFCVLSMIFIFRELPYFGSLSFGASLFSLLISLIFSLREIQISTRALDLELSDMEFPEKPKL